MGSGTASSSVAGYIQLTGNADTLPADTVVKVYTAVVRGAGGGGGGGGLTVAQVQALIDATMLSALQGMVSDGQIPAAIFRDTEFDNLRGNRLMIGAGAVYDDTANTLTVTPPFVAIVGDDVNFVAPASLDDGTDALDFVENITGGQTLPLTDFDGTVVSAVRLTGGRVYSAIRLTGQWRILESLEAAPVQAHQLWAGWSADAIVTEDEVLAGVSSDGDTLTLPLGSGVQYLFDLAL